METITFSRKSAALNSTEMIGSHVSRISSLECGSLISVVMMDGFGMYVRGGGVIKRLVWMKRDISTRCTKWSSMMVLKFGVEMKNLVSFINGSGRCIGGNAFIKRYCIRNRYGEGTSRTIRLHLEITISVIFWTMLTWMIVLGWQSSWERALERRARSFVFHRALRFRCCFSRAHGSWLLCFGLFQLWSLSIVKPFVTLTRICRFMNNNFFSKENRASILQSINRRISILLSSTRVPLVLSIFLHLFYLMFCETVLSS